MTVPRYSVVLSVPGAKTVLRYQTYEEATEAGDTLVQAYAGETVTVEVSDGNTMCWALITNPKETP
jgi:hypothetical protein